MREDMKEEDKAIKFSEIHPSPDSIKAVSRYYKIKVINMIPIAISIIIAIVLVFMTTSMNKLGTSTIIVFVSLIVGIPVIFIPMNIIVSHNSYGKIWYDYFEWYEYEIAKHVNSLDFEEKVKNKYFKEVDYNSSQLNKETKQMYDAEVIKIALGMVFLIIGLLLYIYLMFNTEISFIILTLVMIAFGGICVFIISDATFELRKIKVLGNKINE